MSKCYLLFAEGFEECEGLVTLDILRRAGLEAYTVSIQDAHTVVGAHGVPITCDRIFEFGLDFVQAQSVGERCINIQGFARNLVLDRKSVV